MIRLQVSLPASTYPILVAEGLLQNQSLWQELTQQRPFCIVTDDQVAPLYLGLLCKTLSSKVKDHIVIPAGEKHKNINTVTMILTQWTERYFPRDGLIIALGGGVVGDTVGFAAAVYQRGLDFIQVPTTTLAMLDSSVGGKTAVNLGMAKNNVGAFHQPKAVLIDLVTLCSLNEREYAAGLAEAIKHSLIADADFFAWLVRERQQIAERNLKVLAELIQRSCAIKIKIVEMDERENHLRMLLNFGHTFGHAIEAYNHYQDFKHGEAVAIGMMCALAWSVEQGYLADASHLETTRLLLEAFNLPTRIPEHYEAKKLLDLMQHDKKKREGLLNLVVLQKLGQAVIVKENDLTALEQFLGRQI